jgi:hypothetical protein
LQRVTLQNGAIGKVFLFSGTTLFYSWLAN